MKKMNVLLVLILVQAIPLFSQDKYTLNKAIDLYVWNLKGYIQRDQSNQRGKGIAVIAFNSDKSLMVEYFIDTMTEKLFENGIRPVFERRQLEALQLELDFSLSGEVSDETALRIGRRIGVNTVVYGSLRNIGRNYQITIKSTNVEKAELLFIKTYDLETDSLLSGLLGISKPYSEFLLKNAYRNNLYGRFDILSAGHTTDSSFSEIGLGLIAGYTLSPIPFTSIGLGIVFDEFETMAFLGFHENIGLVYPIVGNDNICLKLFSDFFLDIGTFSSGEKDDKYKFFNRYATPIGFDVGLLFTFSGANLELIYQRTRWNKNLYINGFSLVFGWNYGK
jgi:TolB-like protein